MDNDKMDNDKMDYDKMDYEKIDYDIKKGLKCGRFVVGLPFFSSCE